MNSTNRSKNLLCILPANEGNVHIGFGQHTRCTAHKQGHQPILSRYEMIKAVSKSDAKLLKEAKIKTKQISEKSDKIAEQKAMLENSKAVLDEKSAIIENERDGIESKQAEIAQKKIILAQDRAESDALLAEYAQKHRCIPNTNTRTRNF